MPWFTDPPPFEIEGIGGFSSPEIGHVNMKLTLVPVSFRGKTLSIFVNLPVNTAGKAVCPMHIIDDMLRSLGCGVGQTFSIG